jgi:hypothetical protein
VAPKPSELFSDRSGTAVVERFEQYKDELSKSLVRHDEGTDVFVQGEGIIRNARPSATSKAAADKRLATLETLTKGLTADQLTAIQGDVEALRGELAKDWNTSFPESGTMTLPTQLAPIDLEAPAKLLVPRQTPLRNAMPRNNSGRGSAVQFRRILGWTNSGVGGTPDIMPFMSSEFPAAQSTSNLPPFGGYAGTTGNVASGGLGLRRGQRITYTADSQVRQYTELGLSDSVSWKAQFIGEGYQDIRQMSATALLWSHLMGEERALLYGRGISATGYTGPISAPTFSGAGNVVSASTGGTIPAGTYSVMLTAIGGGGESAPSAVVTSGSAITGTGTLTITFPAIPSGGMGWNVWALNATTGNFFFQGSFPNGQATAVLTSYNAAGPTTANTSVVDTTANPNGYDGMLTILLNPAKSGYVGTYVSSGATSQNSVGGGVASSVACGDQPWQTAFAALYGASTDAGNYGMNSGAPSWVWNQGTAYGQKLLADPDVVYVDGSIRAAMGRFVRSASGGATAYRLVMQADAATGGAQIGAIVNGIANQVTGKMVDFDVHPYMPPGNSLIWSKSLPVPDSEISNTFEVRNVQDYMMYVWPEIQYTYDASTYQLGTLVDYASAWSGAITGLVA